MLITDLDRLRNTLLAARQSVLLAGADGSWLHGYESALVTIAVSFGLDLAIQPQNMQNMDIGTHQKLHVLSR